ncbi:MAG: hypothetical protein RQ899_07895 [Pseudomonadales bacterium]|nr:hypothetical protein [Pseudomonadales bacterium]
MGTSLQAVAQGQSINAVARFNEIRTTIEANHYDSFGATEEGLRNSVKNLEELVNSGFSTIEAERLLADSYHEIAIVYSDKGSPEQEELLSKFTEIYQKLLAANPQSVNLLLAYSRLATGDGENLEAAERLRIRAIEILAEANATIGVWLQQSEDIGEKERGLHLLEEAFMQATKVRKVDIGRHLINTLQAAGQNERATEVQNELDTYRKEMGL